MHTMNPTEPKMCQKTHMFYFLSAYLKNGNVDIYFGGATGFKIFQRGYLFSLSCP